MTGKELPGMLGAVRQLGFVVRDLDRALEYWTKTLGVGPFFTIHKVTPEKWRYRGQPSPAPCVSIALANPGDVQIEIIQQHDDQPTAWRDFLASGREGFHHVSSWLTRAEYDAAVARMLAAGTVVISEGVVPGSGERFAYLATDSGPGGLVFEIADAMEACYPLTQMVAEAARGWDGRDPIRAVPA
jgi:catechol 2,3-dioxygenase-like lactoylglutathione lyase family enzyme